MKQFIHCAKRPISAEITIQGSKSMTSRALLLAALADGVSEISGMLLNEDTHEFIQGLQQLGIVIQVDELEHSCIVGGSGGQFPKKEASIWCKSTETFVRFLLAACATSNGVYHFDGTAQLRRRSIQPLLQALSAQGAKIIPPSAKHMPFTLCGSERLAGGEIEIEGSQTGQFISALLIIAPFAASPVEIISQDIVNRPYVDMTCAMMADFGVLVRRLHKSRFLIPVPQRYKAIDYQIEPDLSTAAFFFAAAAVTAGEVAIQAFDREDSKQGDVKFLLALEKMGCEIIETENEFRVKGPKELRGINIDMRDFYDTFMTIAAIAVFAKTATTITNIKKTRLQEFNRAVVLCEEFKKLNIVIEKGVDWIRIHPSEPIGGKLNCHHDYHLAMAFSVIGLCVPHIEINNVECVKKACPDFFTLWENLI